MTDKAYKIITLVGVSQDSFSDAVDNALARAGDTLDDLHWFEVVEQRGTVSDSGVGEYQVKVDVGFKLHG